MNAAYQLELNAVFSAAHAIVIKGEREPLHGHDWHVTLTVEGPRVDQDGLLVDFHALEKGLKEIVARWHNRNLNETRPFDVVNPTAEKVAEHIASEMQRMMQSGAIWGDSDNPPSQSGRKNRKLSKAGARPEVRVVSVRVTEAVGCAAVYRPAASSKRGGAQ